MFIKKIISAVLVFLLIPIVLFAIDLFVPTKNNSKFFSCTDTVTKALLNPSSIEIPEDTDNTNEEPAE